MAAHGDQRQSWRWSVEDRVPLIGAWRKQQSNNSGGMGEALPAGSSLYGGVELLRPGTEVLGYMIYLYSDGQGWLGGVDGEGLPRGIEKLFSVFQFEGNREHILADGRIQPTGDPIIFYHRSSKTERIMIKVGHTNVSGYYTRCYLWITAYECTESWDANIRRWVEV